MRPLHRQSSRASAGFTLIELVIAVALSTLVGVLIYTVFVQQTHAYRVQSDMSTMQQNLRVAMEMLSRDVSMAGYGTGHDGAAWGVGGTANVPGGGTASNPLYGLKITEDFPTGSARDAIEIFYQNPVRSTWAWMPGTPQACATTQINFHPDFQVQSQQYSSFSSSYIACYAPVLRGRAGAFVWQVSGAGGAGIVPVTGNNQNDFNAECIQTLPANMWCAPAVYSAYYIDADNTDGIGLGSAASPVLYYVPDVFATAAGGGYPDSNDIPIALGIEDLQFELCAAAAGGGSDCSLPGSWFSGYDPLALTNTWSNLTAVRIHVTAKTLRFDPTKSAVSQQIDLDPNDGYALSGGVDAYHRRVATTEVMVRNAVLTWQALNPSW